MVGFASLFLSLIVGLQPVELHADESVASIQILVDGESAGTLRKPPWRLLCDFGEALLPHELVAVAFDADGLEVGRARQWVNLPRSPAEASLVLERDGERVFVRVQWESVVAPEPEVVRVTLDGIVVPVSAVSLDSGGFRVELPDHDPEQLHFVRAELEFPGNVDSVAEMTFGGAYAGGSRTELTAVAVQLQNGRKLPTVGELQGRFHKNGEELRVVATDEGPATVLVVRDQSATQALSELSRTEKAKKLRLRRLRFPGESSTVPRTLRELMPLDSDSRLRFVWPVARALDETAPDLEVFDFSSQLDSESGGLYWLLTKALPPPSLTGEQRLTDAVAVAGVVAARRNRRRVALLVLSDGAGEVSRLEAEQVKHYLKALMVPLVVWTPEIEDLDVVGARAPGSVVWGERRDVSSLIALERAVADLNNTLDRQRLVWVEGLHLPQDITVEGDSGLTIAR